MVSMLMGESPPHCLPMHLFKILFSVLVSRNHRLFNRELSFPVLKVSGGFCSTCVVENAVSPFSLHRT